MSEKESLVVVDGVVAVLSYQLTVDNEVIEDSEGPEGERLPVLIGAGNILPALEAALLGMRVGESKQVTLQPADGYGELDPENFGEYTRSEFPDEIPLEPGTELVIEEDGEETFARIESVDSETVTLNFNHELAGKVLHFNVRVAELRQPTAEELDHGHVHFEGFEEEDEEEE